MQDVAPPGELDAAARRPAMSKHPIDHDRARDDGKVAKEYARIDREQAEDVTDPKVRQMTRDAHRDEGKADNARVQKFLKIDRQKAGK
jgi:hypothetical protein